MRYNAAKIIRYLKVYGLRRTLIKVAGRSNFLNINLLFPELFFRKERDISLIGCGQFGFSTISFFLIKKVGNRFLDCYDPLETNLKRTSKFWGYSECKSAAELLNNPKLKVVYIASNHSTHTQYAIEGLKNNKIVYIEKPIAVSYEQLCLLLLEVKKQSGTKLYVGYNRPFSKAIIKLRSLIDDHDEPITLSCTIAGHFIEKSHWYRNENEGTRICGNVGHWIDLGVNLLSTKNEIPEIYTIQVGYSNLKEIDDNISITLTTNKFDLITIVLTSRAEPFEGINETLVFQSGSLMAKIDDFKEMTIWKKESKYSYRYFPKDVGHRNAINQPFQKYTRDFSEIEISTILMLEITDMVRRHEYIRTIMPYDILKKILSSKE